MKPAIVSCKFSILSDHGRYQESDIFLPGKAEITFRYPVQVRGKLIIRIALSVIAQWAGIKLHQSCVHAIHGVITTHRHFAGGKNTITPGLDFLQAAPDTSSCLAAAVSERIDNIVDRQSFLVQSLKLIQCKRQMLQGTRPPLHADNRGKILGNQYLRVSPYRHSKFERCCLSAFCASPAAAKRNLPPA